MRNIIISDWFDEEYNFKGVEHLPEGLTIDSMWQAISMFPLDDDFIIANIEELDLPLLCINNRITKNVLLNRLPRIVKMMIQDPEIIEDVMSYISDLTDDEELFSDDERIKIAHTFIVILNNQWKYLLATRMEEPMEAFAGTIEAMNTISNWVAELYIDEIISMKGLSIQSVYPNLRTLFMMANIHFDLSTLDWSRVRESEVDRAIEEYPMLLSPANPYIVVAHATEFIRLAAENQEQLIRVREEEK